MYKLTESVKADENLTTNVLIIIYIYFFFITSVILFRCWFCSSGDYKNNQQRNKPLRESRQGLTHLG